MGLKIKHNRALGFENDFQLKSETPLIFENFRNFESFYGAVYQRMFQPLFSYGMQICGNRELVKDCIQELFSELWKNQKTLIKVKLIKPYLFKCLKRKIKSELLKGNRLSIEGRFDFQISHDIKLINDQDYLNNQNLLNKALKSLTDRQREAIYLKFYGNLPYDEIAKILNITTKASYKLISRALSLLKTTMPSSRD